jgi:hypothetical protein
VTSRRSRIIVGVAALLGATLLAGCSVTNPIPFTSATPSPATESAKTPSVNANGPGTPLAERVGISAGNMILWDPADVEQRKLQAVADSGAKWFEMDVDWNSIQDGGPNSWMWSATDRVVRDARARGLKVLGMLGYTPGWARPSSCPPGTDKCLPANPETFAAFARAAAQRYGSTSTIPELRSSISAWQIWNEPNHFPFVQPTVDVRAYTAMLKRSDVEIKTVDPLATVIAGGTSPAGNDPSGRDMAPARFLRQIYAYGGRGFFDAFAHHPYSFPCSPLTKASWNAFTQTRDLHTVMEQNGDGGKKIWGTEAGAPTATDVGSCTPGNVGRSVSEATQSQYLADYFKGWYGDYASFTGPLFWFQIRDNGTNPSSSDDHFGLLRWDFSAKPAYRTLQHIIRG